MTENGVARIFEDPIRAPAVPSVLLTPWKRAVVSSPALPRLSDPLDQFLAGQLSERTRRAYLADLCHFFDKADVQLDDVRAVHFQDVVAFARNRLASEGDKRSSINRKLSSLKSFFKLMVAARVIEQSPADAALVRGYRLEEGDHSKPGAEP